MPDKKPTEKPLGDKFVWSLDDIVFDDPEVEKRKKELLKEKGTGEPQKQNDKKKQR